MSTLFSPYNLAGLQLPNRTVMAPMTRARAKHGVPDEQTMLYYRQRASAGLIISEGVPISREGTGFVFNPGLFTDVQTTAWRRVTDAVHADGGRIFAQLWHVGRLSHVSLQKNGAAPVSAAARQAQNVNVFAWQENGVAGPVPASVPRALESQEVRRVINDFVLAAKRAMDAGFDGVELHGANGYLFEQFINGELNKRDDAYGGSIENRLRLLMETVDEICAAVGSQKLGVRLSPYGRFSDMKPFDDERETWLAAAEALNSRALAYVHLSDQFSLGAESIPAGFFIAFREAYQGTLIAAGGFNAESAEDALTRRGLDLVGFGRPFIANPDLVERMKNGWPIQDADRATFYGLFGAKGYTDYPRYAA
ncbi:alkene reductase [Xanthomonas campestris]|uniref:alkene reductase n=1 Tax=Xanthomonas campestris TaxID=339 RepID=UPI0023583A1A|nr:alkene reductase [Xanthomonas campestris]MDC8746759.1 alkene reductase [Xanthomonas campestris]